MFKKERVEEGRKAREGREGGNREGRKESKKEGRVVWRREAAGQVGEQAGRQWYGLV